MNRRSTLPRKAVLALAIAGLGLTTLGTTVPAEAAVTGVLPTTTTVTPSATTINSGSPVTLTSKVALLGTGLIVIPTGTVTYTAVSSSGTQVLGTTSLSGCFLMPCTTSLTTSALAPGANTITAAYGGNGPTLIGTGLIGGIGGTNTVQLVGPSSATTSVFVIAGPNVTAPPSAPENLVVSAGAGKNTLTWSPPSSNGSAPVTTYTINRKVGAGSYAFLATVNAPTTTYVDNAVTNGTAYTYLVAANNSVGASVPSNSAAGTPQAAATVPSAPTLTATSQVASIKLDWSSASTGGSAISEYRLYRSVSGQNSYTQIASTPTGDYQDTTVLIGVVYDYKATSVNGVGESAFSNVATASATPFAGPNSYQTETCTANSPCTSASATATDPQTGNNTDSTISVESSTGSHTATVAVGGPKLTGCTTDAAVGLSVTFNDTSTDAYKDVTYTIHDADAAAWNAANPTIDGQGDLCLGLGTQWFHGQNYPVTWVPADGLWEGRVVWCANNGQYDWLHQSGVPNGHYSQPCADSITGSNYITFTVHLPPGDGKISGGH